jgi:hypothetical protein
LNEGAVPGKPAVIPTDASSITDNEKKRALKAVNLIKEKRTGELKGRSCVSGSVQRKYLGKDDSVSSPTSSLESLISTLIIDVYEQRDVAFFDIPGAFLQAKLNKNDNKGRTLMKL